MHKSEALWASLAFCIIEKAGRSIRSISKTVGNGDFTSRLQKMFECPSLK